MHPIELSIHNLDMHVGCANLVFFFYIFLFLLKKNFLASIGSASPVVAGEADCDLAVLCVKVRSASKRTLEERQVKPVPAHGSSIGFNLCFTAAYSHIERAAGGKAHLCIS
jgi:hypothetical protein